MLQSVWREMENAICRIAQKARAVGIHMILSTQRPDTKIVTGTIKANFPTRIAFRTVTGTDSRVILDRVGAEKLTGKGDMLFFDGGDSTRVQCAYFSTEEVVEMCEDIRDRYADMEQTYLPEAPKVEATTFANSSSFKMYLPAELYDDLCTYDFRKIAGETKLDPEKHLSSFWYTRDHEIRMMKALGIIDDDYNILINDLKTLREFEHIVGLASDND